jgi:hypothetical protein
VYFNAATINSRQNSIVFKHVTNVSIGEKLNKQRKHLVWSHVIILSPSF